MYDEVVTPLGKGRRIWDFSNGTIAVELREGGGHIFFAEEVSICRSMKPSQVHGSGVNRQGKACSLCGAGDC